MNTAARMESHGLVGEIHVGLATWERLRHLYPLRERGTIDVNGKGEMPVFLLEGRAA